MSLATDLRAAQSTYLVALAARDVLSNELDDLCPEPGDDASEAEYDVYLDAYADAEIDCGYYAAEQALREASDAVITAAMEALRGRPGFDASLPAFEAALGLRSGSAWVKARTKVLDLSVRLDPRTV